MRRHNGAGDEDGLQQMKCHLIAPSAHASAIRVARGAVPASSAAVAPASGCPASTAMIVLIMGLDNDATRTAVATTLAETLGLGSCARRR